MCEGMCWGVFYPCSYGDRKNDIHIFFIIVLILKILKVKRSVLPWDLPPPPLLKEPCRPRGSFKGGHCSVSYLWSPRGRKKPKRRRSRLSGDIFPYSTLGLLRSSSPFLSSHCAPYGGRFPPPGASSSCAPIGPPASLCRGDVRPRRPSAALNGPRSLVCSTPKQLGTARTTSVE